MKLFKGNVVYTRVKDAFEIVSDGFILEDQGSIIEVGKGLDLKYSDLPIEDYSGHLLVPGFVDLHFHAVQYGNLGLGLDEELLNWLNHHTFKEEEKFSDPVYAKKIFDLALDEIIENGTTRIVFFSSIHEQATELLMASCEKKGLAAFVGKVNMDRNTSANLIEATQESFEISKRLIDKSTENVQAILTPRFVPACSETLMGLLGELVKTGIPVQTHISENENEIKWVKALHPDSKNYLDVYDKSNLLSDKTILAHCVYCTEAEKKVMQAKNCFVAHCPASNLNLTSGIMDVKDYLDRGIRVGLGTDVGAGHTTSIKDAIVLAIQMSKINNMTHKDAPVLSFSEAFYLATKGGGAYFGNVGAFEPNYELDMLVIEPSNLSKIKALSPVEELQNFVYSGTSKRIIARYCKGKKI